MLGGIVKNLVEEYHPAGAYKVIWDGRDYRNNMMPNGVFIIEMRVGEFVQRRKITMVK
jgi:hypothetical protein